MEQLTHTIRPLETSDFDAVEQLFAYYPCKQAQRIAQKLDRVKLNRLYLENLKQTHSAGNPLWVVRNEERVIACAGLSPDAWHGQIYGMKMGRIAPWLNYIEAGAGPVLIEAILSAARKMGYEHLSARIDGEEFSQLHLLENSGFRLIDVSMKFSRGLPWKKDVLPPHPAGWRIRLSAPEDAQWMRDLGARAHAHTHFLNDPNLPRERTMELFNLWVARCIEKLAYRIYVLEDSSSGPKGFVIYLRNRAFHQAVGVNPIILDYVILDPGARGGGIGAWFVQETLKREAASGFDFCELRTSAHNLAAIGCYEKLRFRLCATDFALHRYLGK